METWPDSARRQACFVATIDGANGLSAREQHRRIYARLGVQRRTETIARANDLGLL